MKKTLKFTDEDFKNVFPRLELENVEDVIPPIDNTSDKIPPTVGIHKADEQPIVVKLPYEIENQGLYTDPKEKGIIGALGESVWQGVKSNGTAFVNNMDTLAYRGLEKQKKEAEKYLSNHDDLVSEIYKKNIDKFGENGSYADFLKKNIVENTRKQSQNSQAIAEKYADIKGAGTAQYVGEAVGTMLPGIGASITTGIPNIGLAFMASNVFGNAMGRAVSDGADMKKAQSYALADTALEVGIEMLFGGIPSFGEGMISAKNLTSKYLKTTAGRFLANKLVDVTGEGLEEVASEILEPFLERAFIDKSAPNANLKEVAKAFGGGVLISSILGAANISNEINEAKPNAKNYTVASQEYEPQSDKWFGNISDITQARKAYKRYAQEYHPDVSSQTNAAQIMGEINRAYTGWRKYAAQQQYNLGETTDSSKTASKQADANGSTVSLLNAGRGEEAVNSLPDVAKMIGRETQGIIQRFGKDSLAADKLTTQNVATIPQAENVQPTSNKITIQPKEDKLNGYISTLEGVKATNAKTALEGVKGDITKAQFVENNIDDDFILDNKLYYSVNNGKKVPVTKAMYDYAQYLKGENDVENILAKNLNATHSQQENTTDSDVIEGGINVQKAIKGKQLETYKKYGNALIHTANFNNRTSKVIYDPVSYNVEITTTKYDDFGKVTGEEITVIDKNGDIVKGENTVTEKDSDAKVSKNANETQKNTRQIVKTVDNFASSVYNKGNIVHSSLKSYQEKISNGEVFSIEFIKNLPEIIKADKIANTPKSEETFTRYPVGADAERDAERQKIANFLCSEENGAAVFENGNLKKVNGRADYSGTVKQNKVADIVIGPPAAGKSSVFADRLSNEHSARIIDSDIAKEMLPEFNGGYGANAVQEESSYISEVLAFAKAVQTGDNIVIPKVGKSYNSIAKIAQRLKANGYTINLYYNELPIEKAINRGFARFIETGRYIPIEYMENIGNEKIKNTYLQLKESGLIDYYEWKSNDVKFGQEPILKENGYANAGNSGAESSSSMGRDRGQRLEQRNTRTVQKNGTEDTGLKDTPTGVSSSLPEKSEPKVLKKADVKPTLPDLIKEQKEDDLPQSIGAMKHNPKSFSAMANEYGTIKDGENPSRVVDVPKSTDGTNKVRQATRTFMEAEVTPDEMIELFEQAVADNEFSYEAKKDKSTVENAAKYIEQNGYKQTLAEWQKKVDNGKSITKEDVAGAQLMYVAAAKVGDTDTAMKLAADIAAMATNAAQVVQAQRLLKKATPEGRLYTANRSIEHIQKKIDEKYGKKAPKINVPNKLMDNLYNATTQDEINNALDKINRNVSEQLPVTWADRYIAYRYLSMLGNFRTQMRNLGSNLLQMPARKLTSIINAGLEIGLEKAGVKVQRTTSLKRATQEQKDFAKVDYIEMEDILASNGKYQSDNLSDIEKLKNPFKINGTWGTNSDSSTIAKSSRMVTETIAKGLTAWNKATTYAMDKGDILFSRPAYINAIASYMQANNLTAADMKGKTLLGAREWATKQSLESVFREANSIATWLQNTEGKNWITKLVLGGTIPFKRTPLNIAVRSFEYTPMNIIKGAVQLQKAAKTGDVYKVQSAIDSIAKGTSGSTILTIGFFMASLGLLKAGMGNSKKDKIEKEMGAQEYSLQIGDYSMNVEWAGPSVTTLFIGAQIYENLTKDDAEDIDLINTVASLLTLFDPIFESTMLGGLNDTLTQIGYSNNPIAELPVRAAANYVSQFIPTIFGQVARTIDDTRRAVYTTKTGTSKIVDTTAQKMGNKMPFISKSNIPYLDMFGKEVKNAGGNYATRLAYNMFSPGYITKKPDDKVLQAIAEVYDETGDTEIIPIKPTNQYTKDDKQLKMTSEEYEAFAKENGQTAHSFIENMLLDKHYDNLSSAEKAEVIKDIYAYSRKISLYDTLNIELSATNKDKKTALDAEVPPMYVFSKEADANNNGHFDKEETKNYIDSLNDLSNTQKAYLFASMSGAKNPYA